MKTGAMIEGYNKIKFKREIVRAFGMLQFTLNRMPKMGIMEKLNRRMAAIELAEAHISKAKKIIENAIEINETRILSPDEQLK